MSWYPESVIPAKISALPRVASRLTADEAAALRSAGRPVLQLEGSPYWSLPQHVRDAAASALSEPDAAPSQGSWELRRSFAAKLHRDSSIDADPRSEILVTNAANHALSIVFSGLLQPGDEAVMPSPCYQYDGILGLVGAKAVHAPSSVETGWRWDLELVDRAITSRTKLLILNTPTNPTGYVASRQDLLDAISIAENHNLVVVSDEAYDNMLFDGYEHISTRSLAQPSQRIITIYSMTKSYAMRGWRVGFIAAPSPFIDQFRKVLEWNCLSVNLVAQEAARAALDGPRDWLKEISSRFQRARDLMIEGLKGVLGLRFVLPHGTPFLFINVEELGVAGEQFSKVLLTDFGVPSESGSYFADPMCIRLEVGGDDNVVIEAADRIREAALRVGGGTERVVR